MNSDQILKAITLLEQNNYKIIQPLGDLEYLSTVPEKTLKLAILDTETTGLDVNNHEIIELAIIIATYCPESGCIVEVLESFEAFEQPKTPIGPESIRIHGITNEMVFGKTIHDQKVEDLLKDVSLIIAHNASFDRKFIEKRLPIFKTKPWACSFSQIPWKEIGFSSSSLEFVAYKFGFHYSGHRARIDCMALLQILSKMMPSQDEPVLKTLLNKTISNSYKVSPLNTPFESKDLLKNRGYRWDPENRFWSLSIEDENSIKTELNWLSEEIYGRRSFKIEKETSDAFNRFSTRGGKKEMISA